MLWEKYCRQRHRPYIKHSRKYIRPHHSILLTKQPFTMTNSWQLALSIEVAFNFVRSHSRSPLYVQFCIFVYMKHLCIWGQVPFTGLLDKDHSKKCLLQNKSLQGDPLCQPQYWSCLLGSGNLILWWGLPPCRANNVPCNVILQWQCQSRVRYGANNVPCNLILQWQW